MTHPIIRMIAESWSRNNKTKREGMFPKEHEPPFDYTPTQRRLHEMLQENTGAHLLDSGDAYGRAWERNRAVLDFRKREKLGISVYGDSITFEIDLFHYLSAFLTLTDRAIDLQERFEEYNDHAGLADAEDFREHLIGIGYATDNDIRPTFNSYNWENSLAGTIQGVCVTDHYGTSFIMLQIHGGADVRGGYTAPQVFECYDLDLMYCSDSNFSAKCPVCGAGWYTDDGGYHWYPNKEEPVEWTFDGDNDAVFHTECIEKREKLEFW